MLKKVTITGADDSIHPASLVGLTHLYPFVEWGILVSKNNFGNPRFPSVWWLEELQEMKSVYRTDMQLSCHICGSWVRELLLGETKIYQDIREKLTHDVFHMFRRFQINTHAQKHNYNARVFEDLQLYPGKEFIFQYDNVNTELLTMASDYNINHSALFDLSHGVGILPEHWPDLLPGTKCGYAGGLSPDNLEEQIKRIEEKAGDTEIWIDMETHVRSNNDQQFDLQKVHKCLEIASKFVK